MKETLQDRLYRHMTVLLRRREELTEIIPSLHAACLELVETFQNGGKIMVCGNGGSASDSDHIVAELMKGFLNKRTIEEDKQFKLESMFGEEGRELSKKLQGALPAISLSSLGTLQTAIANDVDASMIFAQQVYGYGQENDVLLCISTSGNSENVCKAAMVGRAFGMKTIALTGASGGKLADLCDIVLKVPATQTFQIQEYHLVVYHTLCILVEEALFGAKLSAGDNFQNEERVWETA